MNPDTPILNLVTGPLPDSAATAELLAVCFVAERIEITSHQLAKALIRVAYTFDLLSEMNHPKPCDVPGCCLCATEIVIARYQELVKTGSLPHDA